MTRGRHSTSDAYCERLARRARSSFPFAFRLLPPPKRQAMFALYAFLRATDDLSDGPGGNPATLADWRGRLAAALRGVYSHRVHAALHAAVTRFAIPHEYLFDAVTGCESDLTPTFVATFDDLRTYCYRVASTVGLACVRIWGLKPGATFEQADPLAISAGYAFQLTNILRDLGEDLARGRVYLPADELARFDCPPDRWRTSPRFPELLSFQVERAAAYYRESEPLAELLTPEGRAVFALMTRAYRGLLGAVGRAGPRLFDRRVRLGAFRKVGLMARAWAGRWTG